MSIRSRFVGDEVYAPGGPEDLLFGQKWQSKIYSPEIERVESHYNLLDFS